MTRLCREFNNEYLKEKDNRIRKPHVFFHKDYFGKRFEFDSNWVLSSDSLETMMIRPNEVSLFTHISDVFLEKGRNFINDTIIPRTKHYYGGTPNLEKQKEYYDYFETIMISLIFSYTSIETLVNICIPFYYKKRIRVKGVYKWITKQNIVEKFQLIKKMSTILTDVLKTPNPNSQKWWKTFLELKEIRDEIIHSKQSKSEELYSKLLSNRIVEIIKVNKDIINFYGEYINLNKRELLEDFPYYHGYDDFFSVFKDERFFEKVWKSLHNPSP